MDEIRKQQFLLYLIEFGIPEDKYDDIYDYIENHLNYEVTNNSKPTNQRSVNDLIDALHVLSKINLNNVVFVRDKKLVENLIIYSDFTGFDDIEFNTKLESINYVNDKIINDTITSFNEILNNNILFIHALFTIQKIDGHIIKQYHKAKAYERKK